MTTVVISQPMLFPWPGFFELLSVADVYIHLDDTQFSKGSFTNRIQIKHPNGVKWMTVPLKGRSLSHKINQLEASGGDWKRRHRELVTQSLSGAAHLQIALDLLDEVYLRDDLIDILVKSVESSASLVQLSSPAQWVKSSDLGVEGASSERVLSLVKAVGGTRYVTAHGAAGYLDHGSFERAGVNVEYADYSKTAYPQLHGQFTPYVSILDAIANLGVDARNVIRPRTVSWRDFQSAQGRDETHVS